MAISEAQRKRIKKQLANRRKTRKFREPKFPTMEEMELGSAIIREVKKIDDLVKDILLPELNRLTDHKEERFDKRFAQLAGVALGAALIARMKSVFFGESIGPDEEPRQTIFTRSIKRMVSPFLDRVKNKTEDSFVAEFERQTGTEPVRAQLNVDEFVQDSLKKNVSLIKTIPQQYFSQIETAVDEAVTKGQLSKTLQGKLKDISDGQKNRARLIARDQIGKLTANIEEARQRKSNVKEYIWRTRQDGRVRSFANTSGYSDHKRLEGQIVKWNDPPQTVFRGKRAGERHHAGTDIQCRCFPQAIYDDITGVDHPDVIAARKKTEGANAA